MADATPFPPMPMTEYGVGLCRGCQPAGFCQLGIETMSVCDREQSITSLVSCPGSYEGGPGVAHGGWIASVFDDVLGALPYRLSVPCVTSSLRLEFRAPVPVKRPLKVVGSVEENHGRRWVISGTMHLADDNRALAQATGHFVQPNLDHFERHRERLNDIDRRTNT